MRCGADKLTVVKLKERTTTRRVCSSHLMNAVMPEIPLMAIPVSAFLDQHADLGAPMSTVHFFTKNATGDVPRGYSAMPLALQFKIAFRILLNGNKARPHPIDAKHIHGESQSCTCVLQLSKLCSSKCKRA
ncbi:unnamed protein product [Aphanomyces euteiches]